MRRFFLIGMIALLSLTACGKETATPLVATPEATLTPLPTITPTPVTPLTVLVIPADYPAEASAAFQSRIYALAQSSGMRFQVRNVFPVDEARREPGLRVLVAVKEDPGLDEMSAALPQVRFLAIDVPDLAPSDNLFVLGGGEQTDLQGFMAGYVAALLAADYRVGLILPKENADAELALEAFRNGMTYYCGLCRPAAPPWYDYPVYVEIPEDTQEAQYSLYADALIDRQVSMVFVHPAVASPLLLSYLNEYDVGIIGTFTPDEDYRAAWVLGIQPDVFASLEQAWDDVIGAQPGAYLPSPISLTDLNTDLISEGRQRLIEQVFDDLKNGRIAATYSAP